MCLSSFQQLAYPQTITLRRTDPWIHQWAFLELRRVDEALLTSIYRPDPLLAHRGF